ncbi:rhamnogalacturonan acetylesterase [Streptomyces boninensis]|uniref:rhamnogalacturonan acetylesterase n=1 Tax=Streptomyces boninensis TaxID=2039455 RepID=UPI003B20E6E8
MTTLRDGKTAMTPRTVHIAGDSTAAAKPASAAPMSGWGVALPRVIGGGMEVANHARDGRSSLSFIAEGRLAALVAALRPGDLVLIQFGHNDQKTEDPTRYTDPDTTYRSNLLRMVTAARKADAVPVLLTSVERRRFGPHGTALSTHGRYADAVRAMAAEERAALIDVQAESRALWQRMGPEGSRAAFMPDDIHVTPLGATEVARMVTNGMAAAGLI